MQTSIVAQRHVCYGTADLCQSNSVKGLPTACFQFKQKGGDSQRKGKAACPAAWSDNGHDKERVKQDLLHDHGYPRETKRCASESGDFNGWSERAAKARFR